MSNQLTKMFEPSKERLIRNARTCMMNAQDPWFKKYWEKVLQHLLKAYKKAPEVTKNRIYLETMADIYPKIKQKIILDKDLEGILPLLPLGKESK